MDGWRKIVVRMFIRPVIQNELSDGEKKKKKISSVFICLYLLMCWIFSSRTRTEGILGTAYTCTLSWHMFLYARISLCTFKTFTEYVKSWAIRGICCCCLLFFFSPSGDCFLWDHFVFQCLFCLAMTNRICFLHNTYWIWEESLKIQAEKLG